MTESAGLSRAPYTREFGRESRALTQKILILALAETQFPAVLGGFLALFLVFYHDLADYEWNRSFELQCKI